MKLADYKWELSGCESPLGKCERTELHITSFSSVSCIEDLTVLKYSKKPRFAFIYVIYVPQLETKPLKNLKIENKNFPNKNFLKSPGGRIVLKTLRSPIWSQNISFLVKKMRGVSKKTKRKSRMEKSWC